MGSYSLNPKKWKNFQKSIFLAKIKRFRRFPLSTKNVGHKFAMTIDQGLFRFPNLPVVFVLEPKKKFIYLTKTTILAKRAGRIFRGFDNSQFRIDSKSGQILDHLASEISAFERRYGRTGWVGSVCQPRLLLCLEIELSPLRSDHKKNERLGFS